MIIPANAEWKVIRSLYPDSEQGEAYINYDLFVEGTTIVMRQLVDALPKWIMLALQAI